MLRIVIVLLLMLVTPAKVNASHSSGADPRADAISDLAGTWLAVVQLAELVVPHVETLQFSADGHVVDELWVRAAEAGSIPRCSGGASRDEPSCGLLRRTARARVAIDRARGALTVGDPEIRAPGSGPAARESDERLARARLWFGRAGESTFVRRGDVLTLGRPVTGGQESPPAQVVTFYRVDALFGSDLVAALSATGASVGRVGCLIEAIHGDASAWRELRLRVRDIARVHRNDEARKSALLAERPADKVTETERRAHVRDGGAAHPAASDGFAAPPAPRYEPAMRACQRAVDRGLR